MPLPSPEREVTARSRCDAPVQGDGVMSYHCSLPRDHEQETLDPDDPQPCYATESSRSARMWGYWKQRENERAAADKDEVQRTLIDCPSCKVKSMVIDFEAELGTCENCGAKVPFQQEVHHPSPTSIAEAEQPGKPWRVLEPDHTLADFHCQMRPADDTMAGSEKARCLVCRPLTEEEWRQEERWRMNRGATLGDAVRGYHATLDEKAAQAKPALAPEEMDAILRGERPEGVPDIPGVTAPLTGIASIPSCKVCTSPYRFEVERGLGDGQTFRRIIADLPGLGHGLSTEDIQSHVNGQHMGAEPTKQREGDQRLPAGGDRVVQRWIMQQGAQAYERGEIDIEQVEQINAMMQESIRVGTERYGQPLKTFDGRLNIKDLAEELRDAFVYVSKLQMTAEADRPTLVRMVSAAFSHWDEEYEDRITDHGYNRIAEVAVDRILDWVLVQKIGPEQVLPIVEAEEIQS